MSIETSLQDIVSQEKINHPMEGTDSEKKAAGFNDGTGNKNRFFTPEEWFERSYNGQTDEELPERIFKDVSPEEINELRKKYSFKLATVKPHVPEAEQLDLFKK